MAHREKPVDEIRERLTGLLTDWETDFSLLLVELAEKRSSSEELETKLADKSQQVESLSKRIDAQDTLIESLKNEVDQTVQLKKAIHDRDLELTKRSSEIERQNSEINSKHELIGGLQRDAEGIERLKGAGRVKDQEITRLIREKRQVEQNAAELAEEFKIFSASTLSGIDAMAELEAVRTELDARKALIESLRGDAERTRALGKQLEEKRAAIGKLEACVDQHVRTIEELQQQAATWKGKYAALKSRNPSSEPTFSATRPELTEAGPRPLERVEDVSDDPIEPTVVIEVRQPILQEQQPARAKLTTNRR